MFIGFSRLRFLSQFAKTGLGIVPFGGTQHTYTFKQPILAVLMGLRPTKWDENSPKYCGAGCQPAADWESACRHTQRIFNGLRWAFDRAAGFQHIASLRRDALNRKL
jgi:hypothetical protein